MHNSIYILFTGFLLLASCKKNNPSKSRFGSVTINGRAYQTVVIGAQTWTTENYDGPGGIASPRDDEATLGKYYLFAELSAITLPSSWRIPTQTDFVNLLKLQGAITLEYYGGITLDPPAVVHLRANTTNWKVPGDNQSGFNALPAGNYNSYLHNFPNLNAYATFWSSTPGTNTLQPPSECILVISGYDTPSEIVQDAVVDPSTSVLSQGYSLRFVKDN